MSVMRTSPKIKIFIPTNETGGVMVLDRIKGMHNELVAWRQELHSIPELGFETKKTATTNGGVNVEWNQPCAS